MTKHVDHHKRCALHTRLCINKILAEFNISPGNAVLCNLLGKRVWQFDRKWVGIPHLLYIKWAQKGPPSDYINYLYVFQASYESAYMGKKLYIVVRSNFLRLPSRVEKSATLGCTYTVYSWYRPISQASFAHYCSKLILRGGGGNGMLIS
jgi:hypothetical protein